MKIELSRIDDAFNMKAVDDLGHEAFMDSSTENGGKNNGIRPMNMLLMGVGGCSAIDMVMILKKQRQEVQDFSIEINAEREKDKEPALWKKLHLKFKLVGSIDPKKANKAATLSMEKYCSAAETVRRAGAEITWETEVVER